MGITPFSTSALEVSCWCSWNNTFGPNIPQVVKPYIQLGGILVQQLQRAALDHPRDADTFESRSDTCRSRACPENLNQGAKEEGSMQSSDICITELWGPLSCLQIKGPLDSSHQTPSSRTPPLIPNFTHPPRKGHYADMLHDLFLGLAAMEGSGSTWKCGISREFGECNSGDAHGAVMKSGEGAEYKTQNSKH